MNLVEKTLNSELVYKGKIFDVYTDKVELLDKSEAVRNVIKKPDAVAIVAFRDENTILIVEQYRYAIGKPVLELPAGVINKGEEPLECAKRELEEETGYIAKNWDYLGYFYTSVGFTNEKVYLYQANDLEFVGAKLDEGEFLKCREFKFDDIFDKVMNNEINDSKTMIGILKKCQKK